MKNIYTKRSYILLLSIISTLLWGSAFPVLKITYQELNMSNDDVASRMLLAGIRFLLAGLLLFMVSMFKNKENLIPNKGVFKKLLLLGLFNTGIQYFFFYNGLANTSGIKGAVLASSGTFFVIIAAHFVYHNDKINLSKIIGLLLGFLGIFLVNWTSGFEGVTINFNLKGEGYLILTGLSSAFATLYAKKLSQTINPVILNSWQFMLGSILLIISGVIIGGGIYLKFTLLATVLLVYSSLLSAIAFTIWYNLLKYNTASSITIFKLLIPIFGSSLSALFISEETFTYMILLGLICTTFVGLT